MTSQDLPDPIEILGIPVRPLSGEQLIGTIAEWSQTGVSKNVFHVNAHAMNLASTNGDFRKALLRADLIYCDGAGIQLAARVLSRPLPERLTVMDWLDELLAVLASLRIAVFLLGDEDGVAEAAAQVMEKRHHQLPVVGCMNGFFERTGPENSAVIDMINEARPQVVLVAMGMPTQELWIERNHRRLPPATFVPIGAALRWYSGIQTRPPLWMRDHGLEWLGRLVSEPKRLASRYLIGNSRFLFAVIGERIGNRRF